MVEFTIGVHPAQRQAYIPKEIVEALGHRLKAKPNRYAMVVYPEGTSVSQVVRSVEILLADLKHQEEVEMAAEAKAAAGGHETEKVSA